MAFIRQHLMKEATTVHPTGFNYGFHVSTYQDERPNDFYHPLLTWCDEHFGERSHEAVWFAQRPNHFTLYVWIKSESHAMEFKMRWM